MAYEGSYLHSLRQKVGHDLVLMPGTAVVVPDKQGKILLTLRTDTDEWCLPGGGAEPKSDFIQTAQIELREETGLAAEREDLVAFAAVSSPAAGLLQTYPNGDQTHYFALCFVAKKWRKVSDDIDTTEVKDMDFFDIDKLPERLFASTVAILDQYRAYQKTGQFQAG